MDLSLLQREGQYRGCNDERDLGCAPDRVERRHLFVCLSAVLHLAPFPCYGYGSESRSEEQEAVVHGGWLARRSGAGQ